MKTKLIIGLIVLLVLVSGCISIGKTTGTTKIIDIKLNILNKEDNTKIELFEGEDGNMRLVNKGIDLHNIYVDDRIRLFDSSEGEFLNNNIWKKDVIVTLGLPISFSLDFCNNILEEKHSFFTDTFITRCKEKFQIKSDELNAEIEVILESWIIHPKTKK